MTSHTDSQGSAPTRRRRMRAPIIAVVAMFSVLGGVACAPPSPPAGAGGVEIDFGPLTIPLPPIEIRPPATTVPLGLCSASYQPPGVKIVGATVTIPKVRIDPNNPIITVPNVKVNIPQLRIPVSTVTLSCLGGLVKVTVQPDLIIPSQVLLKAVTLNLNARTITFQDPTFTITGVGLGIASLGDLIIPLPPIVSLPLPSGAISF
jgi:hypothetical protein